jgi:hypothetical protein
MDAACTIPDDLFDEPVGRTAIRLYDSSRPCAKTKVTLQSNLFSFLLGGEKVVHRPGEPISILPSLNVQP